MAKVRREARMINPLVKALFRLAFDTTLDELVSMVEPPTGVVRKDLHAAVDHACQYLVAGGYLIRKGGQLRLTEAGRALTPPLSSRQIEEVMKPGHIKWYGKPYRIPENIELRDA
jgi:hypothetical protein